jgi:hypothetical protein
MKYPGQLVLMDALTIHGSMFRDFDCIVASPPCTQYSYLAMPWSRSKDPNNSKAAKALRLKWETEGPDNRLFDACFRIQREAIEAAGRYIPLIVENVRGAQPWVGRAAWSYGSFYLWGDVPALMPFSRGRKRTGRGAVSSPSFHGGEHETLGVGMGLKGTGDGIKQLHPRGDNQTCGKHRMGLGDGQKVPVYSDPRRNGGKASHLTCPSENAAKLEDGTKIGGDWFSDPKSTCRKHGSRSNARRLASAMIAKIPFELAHWIARVYYPNNKEYKRSA